MLSRRFLCILFLIGTFGGTAALAQLPANQTIQWRLRADANDPNSNIDFRAIVTLVAVEIDGNDVGWAVEAIEFVKPDESATKTWAEYNPPLDTVDGLWWVSHVDPANPELEEFLTTPLLHGRAFADDPGDQDLLYELESVSPTESGPFERTSGVTYLLAAADTHEPVKEGDDEPVETDSTRDIN